MKPAITSGELLARAHAGRFRIVPYEELRSKATEVAGSIFEMYGASGEQVVLAPILMGGGPPARLIADALLGFGIVRAIVPCQIKRYTGLAKGGEAKMLVSLPRTRVKGLTVIGVDDLVDGGQTLAAFKLHAASMGAAKVDTAVIYAKPHSVERPGHCAEYGVTEWLVLPGEELDFMDELRLVDPDLQTFSDEEISSYFEALGFSRSIVADWLALQRLAARCTIGATDHAKTKRIIL